MLSSFRQKVFGVLGSRLYAKVDPRDTENGQQDGRENQSNSQIITNLKRSNLISRLKSSKNNTDDLKGDTNSKCLKRSQDQKGITSWLGIVLAIGSGFFMACTSLFVRLAGSLPFYEMLMARCIGTLIFGPPFMIYYFHPFIPPNMKEFTFIAGRGLLGCVGMAAMFFAVERIPLSDATAIVFTSPVWTAILGYVLLSESWSFYDSFALILSLVGVTLITRPTFIFHTELGTLQHHGDWLAYAAAFCASVALALSYICVRKVKETGSFTLVFYYGIMGMFVGLVIGLSVDEGFKFPDCGTLDTIYALCCAGFSFCGQVCLIFALKLEKAAIVALGRATDIAFVSILQAVFVQTPVSGFSIAGTVLVFSCNVSVFLKKWFENTNSAKHN